MIEEKVAMTSGQAAQRWLSDYCGRWKSVSGAVVARTDTAARRMHSLASWPLDGTPNLSLTVAAKAAIQRGQPVVFEPPVADQSGAQSKIVSLPLRAGDASLGALAVALRNADAAATASFIREFELASASLVSALSAVGTSGDTGDAARLLQTLSLLLAQNRLPEAASALANELAVNLGLERVSVGLLERGHARVIALSHSGEFERRQELVRALAAVMEEAADQQSIVLYPPRPEDPPRIVLAHAHLAARTGTTVWTVPLVDDAQAIGAITFECSDETPPSPEDLALCEHTGALVAPMLALKQRSEQSLLAHLGGTLSRAWQSLSRRGHLRPKLAVLGIVTTLALALLPVSHQIGAPARIEGLVQRVLAAPMDGFLRNCQVRPGDAVKAGDVLAELVDQDLLLEQRRWQADLTQHENALTSAMAAGERGQFSISQAKASEARAQLELIESQLARTRIAAPIDGVVIKGDLTQAIGAPVKRGEPLLTLAPIDQYRLMIEVDERDVGQLQPGQRGRLALSALPAQPLGFAVERVTPVAVTKDGRNTFEVEGRLDGDSMPLRPGLQGVAKIRVGTYSLARALTHRLTDWLQLRLWSWVG